MGSPPFPVLQKLEAEVTRSVEGWWMPQRTEEERNNPPGGPSLRLAQLSGQLAGHHVYQPSSWGWFCVAETGGQLCLPSYIHSWLCACRAGPGTGGFSVSPLEERIPILLPKELPI